MCISYAFYFSMLWFNCMLCSLLSFFCGVLFSIFALLQTHFLLNKPSLSFSVVFLSPLLFLSLDLRFQSCSFRSAGSKASFDFFFSLSLSFSCRIWRIQGLSKSPRRPNPFSLLNFFIFNYFFLSWVCKIFRALPDYECTAYYARTRTTYGHTKFRPPPWGRTSLVN